MTGFREVRNMPKSNANEKLKADLIKLELPFNESFEDFQGRLHKFLIDLDHNDLEIAITLHSLAQSYMMQGNLDKAEAYFQKTVEHYRTTIDEYSLVFSMSQYALVLRPQQKNVEAENLLVEVVKLSKKLGIKKKDTKTWFLKCYFLNLIEIYNERDEAKKLRRLLLQEWQKK